MYLQTIWLFPRFDDLFDR